MCALPISLIALPTCAGASAVKPTSTSASRVTARATLDSAALKSSRGDWEVISSRLSPALGVEGRGCGSAYHIRDHGLDPGVDSHLKCNGRKVSAGVRKPRHFLGKIERA